MKRLLFLMMFLCVGILCNAQETGRIILVKVFEETTETKAKWSSLIKVFHSDNRIETIEVERVTQKKFENNNEASDLKVRETLDRISSMGFELKTSQQTILLGSIHVLTTYVFEKK